MRKERATTNIGEISQVKYLTNNDHEEFSYVQYMNYLNALCL